MKNRIIKYIPGSLKARQKHLKENPPPTPKPLATVFPDKCTRKDYHIVGMFWDYDDSGYITADKVACIRGEHFEAFHYCPHCGKNIVKLIKKIRRG